MHDTAIHDEFDQPFDLDDQAAPGADAPGPRQDVAMVGGVELNGKSVRSMATAALCARMTTIQVWAALDAANETAALALEQGNYAIAKRAVEQVDLLTGEAERRADRCQR
ncbi:MAG: hypothetical protein MEQ74_05045 [Paracoccus sp.]|nr:hypothetical protein [Paracoccus sp. (in: a-proteobacteria)]